MQNESKTSSLEPVAVEINGRRYVVNPFNPIEAFEFFHDYTNALINWKNTAALGRRVFAQCLTPDNESLANDFVFRTHFAQYPEDMVPLEGELFETLSRPFGLSLNDTGGIAKS